jgi:hypothetical protein
MLASGMPFKRIAPGISAVATPSMICKMMEAKMPRATDRSVECPVARIGSSRPIQLI